MLECQIRCPRWGNYTSNLPGPDLSRYRKPEIHMDGNGVNQSLGGSVGAKPHQRVDALKSVSWLER